MISPSYFRQLFEHRERALTLPEEFSKFIKYCQEEEEKQEEEEEKGEEKKKINYTHKHVQLSKENIQSKQNNVIIPFTGGKSSSAALWWTLKQGNYKPWLLFIDGFSDTWSNAQERKSSEKIFMSTIGGDGKPLCDSKNRPRFLTLPSPKLYKNGDRAKLSKYHPVNIYILLYSVYQASKEKKCSKIIWSAFDRDREIVESFKNYIKKQSNIEFIFPFENREEVVLALRESEAISNLVTKNKFYDDRLSGPAFTSQVYCNTYSCVKVHNPGRTCKGCDPWKNIPQPDFRWTVGDVNNPSQPSDEWENYNKFRNMNHFQCRKLNKDKSGCIARRIKPKPTIKKRSKGKQSRRINKSSRAPKKEKIEEKGDDEEDDDDEGDEEEEKKKGKYDDEDDEDDQDDEDEEGESFDQMDEENSEDEDDEIKYIEVDDDEE